MIRLKQTMGNVIKGKIEAEQMISKYECNLLNTKSLIGLLSLHAEVKSGVITYSGEVKRNLASEIQISLGEKELYEYVYQTVQTINDVRKSGLDPKRLVLNPEWIFLTKDEKKIKFIYCPVNGLAYQYDGVLFLKDLVFQASLNVDVRDAWDKWLNIVSKTGITDKSLLEIDRYLKNETKGNRVQETLLDENGEALTGLEDMPEWGAIDDDEALTGMETWPDWASQGSGNFDDDDEAPTGMESLPDWMEDANIFTDSGAKDGTYTEATSEPFSQSSRGYGKTPTLVRKKTGESVSVEKDNFKLGRSEQRADFCIRDNSGVSNIHATIIKENNQYYLKDNYSTNGTYVDGEKILDSSTPVLLHDGSIIQLYDEEIIFNL